MFWTAEMATMVYITINYHPVSHKHGIIATCVWIIIFLYTQNSVTISYKMNHKHDTMLPLIPNNIVYMTHACTISSDSMANSSVVCTSMHVLKT